ncbi:MAG TPA: hypothetical protein VGP08_14090 [Pyrinomonadaceae bacterium]|jgi:hypothetical protein|nr:hypothetical protein [Pyrinomonadaceae bacterium]
MFGRANNAGLSRVRRALFGCAALALACVLLVYAAVRARRAPPVVETVTTPARPAAALPTPSPVYFTPQLPQRDAEVELAGDRIAEVEVYLKKRQSAAALSALTRARRATARALEARQHKGAHTEALLSTLKGLDSVQRAIERGAYDDAHRQLVTLDRGLDGIN